MAGPSKNLPAVRDIALTPAGTITADDLRAAIRNGEKLHLNLDDADVAAAILERKLGAESIEELDTSAELDDDALIYGKPVRVIGAGFRNQDEQYAKQAGSLGIYVIVNVVTEHGETFTVGTGALDVVVTVNKLLELDRLGKDWWVIAPADKDTKAGFRPINMTRATADSTGKPF